ncbi:MAG: NAD(P)/FAD-dependent oxidoreductase [Flavobacteriales bacterium]
MKHIAIIGNGISGTTLARHIRKKSDFRISLISSESTYFYSRPALMYVYMGHMPFENTQPYENFFWKKNRIDLVENHVDRIDHKNRTLYFTDKSTLVYDELVLATGSRPRKSESPGNHLRGVQGLVSKQELELMEENTRGIKTAVVAGGGLIGIEMVEMLCSRGIEVHYLIREFKFWNKVLPNEESDLVAEHVRHHGVHLNLNTEIKEIKGDSTNRVTSVITSDGNEINCGFVGIATGVIPNIDLAQSAGVESKKGFLVNHHLETNVPGIYAIGDCAQFAQPIAGRLEVEQIWYTGRMQAETLAETICGKRSEYKPQHFFNSAKLFDIEYQVYSRVVNLDSNENDSLYWGNLKEKKSIRVFYRKSDGRFEGVTLLGIRYRHEVCDRWLKEERHIEYVLQHLADTNFDPEFYKHYENELLVLYNKKHNKNIQLVRKSWKRILGIEK